MLLAPAKILLSIRFIAIDKSYPIALIETIIALQVEAIPRIYPFDHPFPTSSSLIAAPMTSARIGEQRFLSARIEVKSAKTCRTGIL